MKVRFAPSPTGSLHVGGARTALYNYLLAKKNNGQMILRIEDTDLDRNIPNAANDMMKDLIWLGILWSEGCFIGGLEHGDHGPYAQSMRSDIYKKYAELLIEQGLAYYCFLDDNEIEFLKEKNQNDGLVHHFHSPYRDMDKNQALELLKTKKATIRVKVDAKEQYVLHDKIRGEIVFPSSMISDFVIMRSNGMPVYNFCCVIDDYLMQITDVLRGEEHLSNTLKQMILYKAFNWPMPNFAHLSVIVGEDRKKLSKREGSVSVSEFKKQGYLPEALINFLALLGWSDPQGREILSMNDLVSEFSYDRLHSSSAYFDRSKLLWMNAQYLRKYESKTVKSLLIDRGVEVDISDELFNSFWKIYLSDSSTLVEVENHYKKLYQVDMSLTYPDFMNKEKAKFLWNLWLEYLNSDSSDILMVDNIKAWLKSISLTYDYKGKDLYMPLRWAVIRILEGVDFASVSSLLYRNILISRVKNCIDID